MFCIIVKFDMLPITKKSKTNIAGKYHRLCNVLCFGFSINVIAIIKHNIVGENPIRTAKAFAFVDSAVHINKNKDTVIQNMITIFDK
tara:strand:+ start:253 stop:513 length:261 start_codon:yes stop_codon:yes gene_type:complete